MLESDYSQRFHQLVIAINWTIEQPEKWSDYFVTVHENQSWR